MIPLVEEVTQEQGSGGEMDVGMERRANEHSVELVEFEVKMQMNRRL